MAGVVPGGGDGQHEEREGSEGGEEEEEEVPDDLKVRLGNSTCGSVLCVVVTCTASAVLISHGARLGCWPACLRACLCHGPAASELRGPAAADQDAVGLHAHRRHHHVQCVHTNPAPCSMPLRPFISNVLT